MPEALLRPVISELGTIVFAARAIAGRLSKNDYSDLIHLATAIHHSAAGFVTGEKRILKHASELRDRFGLDVVGSGEFVEFIQPSERATEHDRRSMYAGDELEISEMPENCRIATMTVFEPSPPGAAT